MTDNERKELLMKAKPILFNTEMVRAILDGRKTVTRRVVKPQPMSVITEKERRDRALSGADPYGFFVGTLDTELLKNAPYHCCDILYVRETWAQYHEHFLFKTNCPDTDFMLGQQGVKIKWHPSIHMPKEAARIFLRVTNVRIEELQNITVSDAIKEGTPDVWFNFAHKMKLKDTLDGVDLPNHNFIKMWDSTIKKSDLDKYGWSADPFVWVIEFERID